MKRVIVLSLLLLFTLHSRNVFSQTVFWYETFGVGLNCNQGGLANGSVPTVTNGMWTSVALASGPGNGAQANEWFMSATEAGRPIGQCGDGCLNNAGFTNRSLHIGANIAPPLLDPNATYVISPTSNTNKRVFSPFINCSGKNNITLSFNYLANGNPGNDFCEVLFDPNNSNVWQSLGPLAPSVGTCAPVGLWTSVSFNLPNTCDGSPNLRIAFRWQNNSGANSTNVSVAIDEVTLSSPVLQFTVPSQACTNVSFMPTITQSANPTTSYSWTSNPAGLNFNPNPGPLPVGITATANGVYTITGFALNGAAITASSTATISIVNFVTFSATASPDVVCIGDVTTLSASGGTAYTWNPGNIGGSPVVVSPSVPTVYTVTGFDPIGCPGTGSVLVTIGQSPILSVVVSASAVCVGFTSTLTASGAATYTWTSGNLVNPSNQPSIAVGPGCYTVDASAPPLPCPSRSVICIQQAQPLNIVVSTNPMTATTCIETNFPSPRSKAVGLCAAGAGSYTWQPAASVNYSLGPCVLARPPVSTCYTVTGETSVCQGSAIVCVTVIPQFTMDVIPKQPILCVGDSMRLTIANIGTLGIGPYSYNWIEPINAPPPSINDPLSGTVMISPTNSTTPLTYSAEVFDYRGCASAPRLVSTTVLPQPVTNIAIPTIGGNAVPTNSICFLGPTVGSDPSGIITLTATTVGSPVGDYTYTWIPGYSHPYDSLPYVSIIGSRNNNTVMIAAPVRTPAVVVYSLMSGYNGIGYFGATCKRMDTVSIRVVDCRAVTAVSFTTATANDTICSRTCVTFVNFTDTMAGGPVTYTWHFPGGAPATSTLTNPTICYNLPGVYNVLLWANSPYPKNTNPPGSSYFKGFQSYIKVVDQPNTQIIYPQDAVNKTVTIRFGQQVAMTATNAMYYTWSDQYNISNLTGPQTTVAPHKTHQYVVTGCNSRQCCYNDTMNVIVIEDCGEMYVPNAFSPNNDGNNDVLYVRGICLQSMTFMIFNRWGEKVFESDKQDQGWDGTYNGELMNTGVFVYRVEGKTWDGKAYSMKGNVTLIR
jgi:gliding motility-associated-like protein